MRHTDGNLYGSTLEGGVLADGRPAGAGQFYRVRFGPTPVTLSANSVTSASATLHGTLNPNRSATVASFEYSPDPELTRYATVPAGNLPPTDKTKRVSAQVSQLQPGKTYYFRVVGQNPENEQPQRGAILSFTTPAAP